MTFAMAGLLNEQIRSSNQKVPVLGDIPVIGAFFRNVSHDKLEQELMIFVTPKLVRPLAADEVPGPPGTYENNDPTTFELFALGLDHRIGSGRRTTRTMAAPRVRSGSSNSVGRTETAAALRLFDDAAERYKHWVGYRRRGRRRREGHGPPSRVSRHRDLAARRDAVRRRDGRDPQGAAEHCHHGLRRRLRRRREARAADRQEIGTTSSGRGRLEGRLRPHPFGDALGLPRVRRAPRGRRAPPSGGEGSRQRRARPHEDQGEVVRSSARRAAPACRSSP